MGISENLAIVLEKINSAAIRSGRNPDEVKLVAVTKTISLHSILEVLKEGTTILGENRVQEARDKINKVSLEDPGLKAEWHLIGNLQKNKAKTAVQLFDLIHSLDSVSLAEEINRQAKQAKKVQRVLVQVKLSEEMTKHGISPKNLTGLLEKVSDMDYLKLEGIMTMSPFFEDPEETRPYFRKLRHLSEKASKRGFPVMDLSMGMTNDFRVAIEEGATMVRIGTAIFGKRDNSA